MNECCWCSDCRRSTSDREKKKLRASTECTMYCALLLLLRLMSLIINFQEGRWCQITIAQKSITVNVISKFIRIFYASEYVVVYRSDLFRVHTAHVQQFAKIYSIGSASRWARALTGMQAFHSMWLRSSIAMCKSKCEKKKTTTYSSATTNNNSMVQRSGFRARWVASSEYVWVTTADTRSAFNSLVRMHIISFLIYLRRLITINIM